MKPQEPKTFEDILELQKILDNNIRNYRERTADDIRMSMIAEIIEFNEETKDSHKTWKSKPYDREKELEELTDIFFFFAQLVNYRGHCASRSCMNEVLDTYECESNIYYLISLLYDKYSYESTIYYEFLRELMGVVNAYGYTKDDILKTYWKKWQKNMARIGKEWD